MDYDNGVDFRDDLLVIHNKLLLYFHIIIYLLLFSAALDVPSSGLVEGVLTQT
jgi:hypothetical protein